jgi:hypothetical protein
MKVFKTAAFILQLNNNNNNNDCRLEKVNSTNGSPNGRSDVTFAFSFRHHPHFFVNDEAVVSSRIRRRRRRCQSSLPILQSKKGDDDDDTNNRDESNINNCGIFLDLETYLRAEETLLRPDGSLSGDPIITNKLQNQKIINDEEAFQSSEVMQGLLFPPTYSYEQDDLSDEEELLLRAGTGIQNNNVSQQQQQQQLIDAETLHQQVFAEEQVYLEQSEEFRKSLSNNLYSDDDNYETPMARGRREALEEYNQQILMDLMREIEEMEASAVSREEALSRAKTTTGDILIDNGDVMDVQSSISQEGVGRNAFCSQCGLRVTPDMIQRATYGPQKLLCQACYGVKFRIKDEADVRLAAGPSIWESNNSMYDKKKNSETRRGRLDKSRMKRGSFIDTSSLFRIPDSRKMPSDQSSDDFSETPSTRVEDDIKYHSPMDGGPPPPSEQNKQIHSTRTVDITIPTSSGNGSFRPKEVKLNKPSKTYISTKQERRPTASRLLGGRELERRKTQQQPDDDVVESNLENSALGLSPTVNLKRQEEVGEVIIQEDATPDETSSTEWIKVEDSITKRIMFWNKETGVMKHNID